MVVLHSQGRNGYSHTEYAPEACYGRVNSAARAVQSDIATDIQATIQDLFIE